MVDTLVPNNPYVGPRSFRSGEAFFGRDREIRLLSAMLIAERIVLLHSPSGAGKSSLIQAGLAPHLAERFGVFPPVRVNLEPPEEVRGVTGLNRYVLSTLVSLEEGLPVEKRLPLTVLAGLRLEGYLEKRSPPDETRENSLLLFDQFEEVLTVSPNDGPLKQEFFEQLGESLQNRHRWALFAVREDYMGGLAPYARAIPNRLGVTFRLELLGLQAARLAIQQPAKNRGVDFTDEAAEKLVEDLSRIQIQQPDGSFVTGPGPSVEPVQLQVVCFNLWQSHAADDKIIDEGDLQRVGSVDHALASYYATAVRNVAESANVPERILRQWFDKHLITPDGIRSQVLKGAEYTEGLQNIVLRLLEVTHLIRGETRAGKTWYELSHDRMVGPVRQDNAAWFDRNLSLLQRQAVQWNQKERGEGLLLRGDALEQVEAGISGVQLTPDEQAFLDACLVLRKREQRDLRQRQFIIAGLAATLVFLALAVLGFFRTNEETRRAQNAEDRAVQNLAKAQVAGKQAEQSASTAMTARADAVQERQNARSLEIASLAAQSIEIDPELILHLAVQIITERYSLEGEGLLRRALLSPPVKLTLQGHYGAVYSIAYDHAGTRLVTASADGTARIWDAETGQVLLVLSGHSGAVNSAVFSPDGKLVATGGADTTVRLWDAASGQMLQNMTGHSGAVNSVAFSPDGQKIISASDDKTARIWNVESGSQDDSLEKHTASVRSALFSPDGRYIATGGYDAIINIWDAANHSLVKSLSNGEGVSAMAFSPDSQSILSTWGYNAQRLNIKGDTVTSYVGAHTWYLAGVSFSPDGKQVVTASRDHTVNIWDAESGTSIINLRGHSGAVYAAAYDPSGNYLATASDDHTVRIWDIGTWRKSTLFGYPGYVFRGAYSPDGHLMATTGSDGMLRGWNAQTGSVVSEWPYPDYVANRVHFSPDGRQLITSSDDATWRIWDIATQRQVYQSNGTNIISDARFSPDGTRILTTSRDGLGMIWDAVTKQQLVVLRGHGSGVWTGAFSPDGQMAVTSSADGTARIWNTSTGEQLQILTGHSDLVTSAAFDSAGKRIVTASVDSTARIWDAGTGQTLFVLTGHTAEITDAVFSPDGHMVATASRDHTVILWNADTGIEIIQLVNHKKDILSVEFSPDGRYLLTTSLDGTARIDPVHFEDVLALARSVLSQRELTCEERVKYLFEQLACPTPTAILTLTP